MIRAVPRLKDDIFTLRTLMANKLPIKIFIRGNRIAVVRYGFGDVSGTGLVFLGCLVQIM